MHSLTLCANGIWAVLFLAADGGSRTQAPDQVEMLLPNQVVDKEAGADCKRVLKAASSNRSRSSAVKQRFQEGSIDEISFLGKDVSSLHSPFCLTYIEYASLSSPRL